MLPSQALFLVLLTICTGLFIVGAALFPAVPSWLMLSFGLSALFTLLAYAGIPNSSQRTPR
jgi:CHASE2 domain-containing sensor protein